MTNSGRAFLSATVVVGLALDAPGLVFVGDGADALAGALPEAGGSTVGSQFEYAIEGGGPGDAADVTTTDEGLALDGDAIRRRAGTVAEARGDAAGGG